MAEHTPITEINDDTLKSIINAFKQLRIAYLKQTQIATLIHKHESTPLSYILSDDIPITQQTVKEMKEWRIICINQFKVVAQQCEENIHVASEQLAAATRSYIQNGGTLENISNIYSYYIDHPEELLLKENA